jgi:simple sugar transport system permease protein
MKAPFRLERRLSQPKSLNWMVPLLSVVGALIIGAIVLMLTGKNPLSTYHRIISVAFSSRDGISSSINSATPLAFTGLCAAITFRTGIINIGGEGQFFMGAVGAAWAALALDGQPRTFVIIAMILMAMLFGGIYAAIAGVLKARFNTNEIITTLMLNYMAGIFLDYLIFDSKSYWRDPKSAGFPTGKMLNTKNFWPQLKILGFTLPLGFVLAIITAGVLWFMYSRTRFGYEMGVISDSPKAARYSGIRIRTKIIVVMAIAGAIAGFGGASDVGDFRHVLDAKGLQLAGYGYTGIVVAALARYNPISAIFVAVVIGGLTNAGYALQGPNFPSGLVGTLQGLILFTAVAGEVLTRYRIRMRNNQAEVAA